MPRIVSLQPDAVAAADLGHFAYKIDIGVTLWHNVPAFSLLYRYPPGNSGAFRHDGAFMSFSPGSILVLARVAAKIAESVEELQPVADTSLVLGEVEKDIARMTEAYQLFRNNPRLRADDLDSTVKESAQVIRGYWSLRDWMRSGMEEKKEIVVASTTMVCLP